MFVIAKCKGYASFSNLQISTNFQIKQCHYLIFLRPIDLKKIIPKKGYYTSHLGRRSSIFPIDFPDLEQKTDIAIIGVQDDRNAVNNPAAPWAPIMCAKNYISLNEGNYKTKIVDLGNIRQGATVTDTYFAVKTVVNELIKKRYYPHYYRRRAGYNLCPIHGL